MTATWNSPTPMNGSSLPIITSSGVTGIASRFSIVPRSRSRVTASEVMITMVRVRMVPTRPGHDVVAGEPFRVVAAVDAQVEGGLALGELAQRPLQVMLERPDLQGAQGAQRVAGGDRVAGVALDQQLRAVAAQQVARRTRPGW